MRYSFLLILVIPLLFQSGCSKRASQIKLLNELTSVLAGSYENSQQATADTNYHNMTLRMCQIWEDNNSPSRWLYSEERLVSDPSYPVRQRIYEIKLESDTSFFLDTYLFQNFEDYEGKCDDKDFFVESIKENNRILPRCTIRITKIAEDHYHSSILDLKACTSRRYDIAYQTTSIEIKDGVYNHWLRGYNYDDEQTYGPVSGGYEFVKVRE